MNKILMAKKFEYIVPMENGKLCEIPRSDDGQFNGAVKTEIKEGNDILADELKDHYIGIKINLPYGAKKHRATVKNGKRIDDGKELIVTMNPNPLLDTKVYEVEFPDGAVGENTANIIAESIYSYVDEEGSLPLLVK